MFKNYFKSALRSLWKNKTAGIINLFGLSVGMTAAVFIFLWVYNETHFNDYHPDSNNIYRITNSLNVSKDETWVWETSPMFLGETAQKQIPGIKDVSRIIINTWGTPVLHIGHDLFAEKTSAWVDKNWFDLFQYKFISGSAVSFSQNPFSMVLTESKAKKYFGNSNVTGQVIKVDSVNYTIVGVVRDNPSNSSFQSDVLLQMGGRLANTNIFNNDKTWNNFGYITFLHLRPDANIAAVTKKINEVFNVSRKENTAVSSLRPLKSIYLETDLQSSEMPHGNRKITYIFSVLGLLLLITACINYVNLTTAKASIRAKEVSIRKIIGAGRSSLFLQFVTESLFISLCSLLLTIFLVYALLPVFNLITEKNFVLQLTSINIWKILGGTLLFATLMNGIYPALLLSSFQPLSVFRGRSVLKLRDGFVRKGLVVFQFGLSMILIVGTIVIYRQLNFIQTTNPGYNVAQVMSIEIPWTIYGKMQPEQRKLFFNSMKNELQSNSSIAMVSSANGEIVNVDAASSGNADWDGRDTMYNPTIGQLAIDKNFASMFQLQLKEGSWFKTTGENDKDYILNETAANELGIRKPIVGQRFTWGGDTGRVAGVVKDFHFKNLHEKIGPLVIRNADEFTTYLFLKIAPGNIQKAISATQAVWSNAIPSEPFRYNFLDDSFNKLYKADIKTSRLVFIFSCIAVVIAALGLLALAAFASERRVKEIGIRKVLGASVSQIVSLLSKDFVALVMIAIVLASPLAWWLMNKWLEDFAYRIHLSAWLFIAAGAVAIIIAVFSVGVQAIKAAVSNPVKSLRTE